MVNAVTNVILLLCRMFFLFGISVTPNEPNEFLNQKNLTVLSRTFIKNGHGFCFLVIHDKRYEKQQLHCVDINNILDYLQLCGTNYVRCLIDPINIWLLAKRSNIANSNCIIFAY